MAVIDIKPFLKIRPKSKKAYGEKIVCPNPDCASTEYWEFRMKPHIDGSYHVTAAICTSDECDGDTMVEFRDGVIQLPDDTK